ncbi:MAG TPA: DUF971 domain-containing protein [Steroidobacteraceae bacterium]|jgi:DUF971 family protein|nr:DUF971 domain-containing protein [Steroidobacteraceae bacterium]
MADPRPTEIKLRRKSRVLEVVFDDGTRFELPFEYLRVYSPSAEVRGHGAGQEVLQFGKENVQVTAVEPTGQYAVRLLFDDGHNTGLYSWKYLYELGSEQPTKWRHYLDRLAQYGYERKPISDSPG